MRDLYQRRGFSTADGPFENDAAALRQCLVNLLKRHHVGRLRAIRVKPHRCEIDERVSFCLASPGQRDRVGSAPCSVNEVCDLRFGIDIEVEEAGTERGVLRHHHHRDDFLALDDVKFEAVVFLNCLFPLLSVGVADFGGRHEEEHL